MTASLQSVEDICNAALDLAGFDRRIGDIYEGTKASKVALDLYAQTRDALLRKTKPGFANRDVILTLVKTAQAGGYTSGNPWNNTFPPSPWGYEFTYPSDCLELLYIQPANVPLPDNNPLPQRFKIYNDQSTSPATRTILANITPALAVYVGQVTDMLTWDALFTDLVVQALAKRFVTALQRNQQLIEPILKEMTGMEATTAAEAAMAEET